MKNKWIFIICLLSLVVNLYFVTRIWWTNKYDVDDFNCVDMSYSLAPYFHFLGVDTQVIYGSNNETAHCWLCLDGLYFDATSLWFNTESSYHVNFVDHYPYGYWDELEKK